MKQINWEELKEYEEGYGEERSKWRFTINTIDDVYSIDARVWYDDKNDEYEEIKQFYWDLELRRLDDGYIEVEEQFGSIDEEKNIVLAFSDKDFASLESAQRDFLEWFANHHNDTIDGKSFEEVYSYIFEHLQPWANFFSWKSNPKIRKIDERS